MSLGVLVKDSMVFVDKGRTRSVPNIHLDVYDVTGPMVLSPFRGSVSSSLDRMGFRHKLSLNP